MHLSALLQMNGRKYPDKDALIMGEEKISFAEWNRLSDHLAAILREKGITRGDRVVMMMPNVPDFALFYFAVIRAGGIIIPINARSSREEVMYILRDSEAKGLLVHDLLYDHVSTLPDEYSLSFYIKSGAGDGKWESLWEWKQIEMSREDGVEPSAIGEDEPLCMLYTSGTTGRPKGVLLSNRNVMTVATMFAIEMEINTDSKLLHLMPLSHSAPLNLMFSAGVLVGATHVLAPTFSPDLLLELTQSHKTTHFFGAPVAYLLTMKHPRFKEFDLSSTKCWVYGGAPLSGPQAELVGQGFGLEKLVCVYGLTEAGPSGTLLCHRDHPEKAGSIGNRAALFAEVEIVNEDGKRCQPGEIGEIRIRGEGNMIGYHHKPEETEKTLRDGWVYTGDLAQYDESGFIWVIDRKKDMIISGGVNIYSKEIELALESHPDIQELAVVGVPHQEWGETVKAFIVTNEGTVPRSEEEWVKEVSSYLRGKVADYKIPRMVEVISELPRNASGKILKHVLRERSVK